MGDSLLLLAHEAEVRARVVVQMLPRSDLPAEIVVGGQTIMLEGCCKDSMATYEFLRRFQIGRYLVLLDTSA